MEIIFGFLLTWLMPVLLGTGAWWLSNKVRGRNGQKALRFTSMGFWTFLLKPLLVFLLPLLFPPLGLLVWLIAVVAYSVPVCFFLAAGNSMLKEMRAQQRGENTERAL